MASMFEQAVLGILLAIALFLLFSSDLRRPPLARHVRLLGLITAVGAGIAWALQLGWVADDAFISFRYARNWVNGHGLVFNPGERVEGYTNFLWIVLLSPFQALGLSLPPVAVALNLVCSALTVIVTARFASQLGSQVTTTPPALRLPIAACLLALNYTFASFATSGLETMLGTLLVLLAVQRAEHRAPLASGTLAIAATLTHPDHAIFYACLACTFAQERRFRELARYALPFLLVYVPYFAWRWSYYGDFFPNTYYAKNASQFYFSQGALYLALSGISSGLIAALPLAVYAMLGGSRARVARFCVLAIPSFSFYVAKIGGDFMLGRLLCPLLPLVYILAELGLRSLASRHGGLRLQTGAALALLCTTVVPVRVVKPTELVANVADERTFYPIASYLPFSMASSYWDWAHAFNRTFRALSRPPTLAMYSVGIVSYETGLPMVDNAGLNHRAVAHWRIRHRGRPGHEKIISPGLLVQSEADLSDVAVYPEPYRALGRVDVDGVRFHAVKYDDRLFAELALAGVRPAPLLDYIRRYTPPSDRARLECDLWHMRQLYFQHNPASPLRDAVLRGLGDAYPRDTSAQQFALTTSPPDASAWRRVASMDFDTLDPGTERTGDALLHNPMAREAVGQPPLAGTLGRFINTFQDDNGELATGELRSEVFEIQGDIITLNVGGGYDPEGIYVELLVDGVRRFHATGCDSGILGRRVWETRGLRGELAVLHIVDQRTRPFGHIVVDDLVQWASASPPGRGPLDRSASGAGVDRAVAR